MLTPINKENIPSFAYTNIELLKTKPRAVVVEFHGLGGGTGMIVDHSRLSRFCAEQEMVYIIPYYGPWAWMNDKAVSYTDEVLDAVFDKLELDEYTPVISSGYSMGGLGALVYCRRAKRTPAACTAICPVCDLPYHYTERPDLPRTIYLAYSHYDMTLSEAMEQTSPLHLVPEMPDIPYLIFGATADTAVSMPAHSDKFVAAMKERGLGIEYYILPDRGHCDMTEEAIDRYHEFISSFKK